MTVVADTSWLYALLTENDPHHEKARREAERHERIYVPPAALVETLNLVQYRATAGHATALRAQDALAGKPNMVLGEPPHDHEATVRVWRKHADLSYADAAIVAAARAKSAPLCTFDKKQDAAYGALP